MSTPHDNKVVPLPDTYQGGSVLVLDKSKTDGSGAMVPHGQGIDTRFFPYVYVGEFSMGVKHGEGRLYIKSLTKPGQVMDFALLTLKPDQKTVYFHVAKQDHGDGLLCYGFTLVFAGKYNRDVCVENKQPATTPDQSVGALLTRV